MQGDEKLQSKTLWHVAVSKLTSKAFVTVLYSHQSAWQISVSCVGWAQFKHLKDSKLLEKRIFRIFLFAFC